jgi:hypothetical protein
MNNASQRNRRRNISWDRAVDELAEILASRRRIKGGVSEYLARLVRKDAQSKKGLDLICKAPSVR